MHPILARGGRLALYLGLWAAVGVLLGVLLAAQIGLGWRQAGLVALPLALSLRVRLPVGVVRVAEHAARGDRRRPHRRDGRDGFGDLERDVAARRSHVGGLARAPGLRSGVRRAPPASTRCSSAFGVLLYLLSLAVSYLLAVFEQTRDAERRALQVQVLAREAELRMLRAQIDPHFLFNSLHSISALTGSDAGSGAADVRAARRLPARKPRARRGRAASRSRASSGSSRASWPSSACASAIGCVTRSSSPTRPIRAWCRRCCCSRSWRTR